MARNSMHVDNLLYSILLLIHRKYFSTYVSALIEFCKVFALAKFVIEHHCYLFVPCKSIVFGWNYKSHLTFSFSNYFNVDTISAIT